MVLEVCAPGAIGWQGRSKVLVWALGDDSGSALGSLRSLLPSFPIHLSPDQLTSPYTPSLSEHLPPCALPSLSLSLLMVQVCEWVGMFAYCVVVFVRELVRSIRRFSRDWCLSRVGVCSRLKLIFRSVRMSLGKHGRHLLDSFGIACQRAL